MKSCTCGGKGSCAYCQLKKTATKYAEKGKFKKGK